MIPLAPLRKRPMYHGLLGAILGVSSVIGLLRGGVFTNSATLTWRWCFYINLLIGVNSVLIVVCFLHLLRLANYNLGTMEKLKQLEPIGNLIFVPSRSRFCWHYNGVG